MSVLELHLIFVFGLVSSLHCVQMCGPIVLSFSLPFGVAPERKSKLLSLHLSYNAGRIVTYAALGALAGAAGNTIDLTGKLAGVEHATAILTGGLMILAGLILLDVLPQRYFRNVDPLRVTSRFLKPLGRRITATSIPSKFILGLMLGFLPCGLIYAALLKAMATSNPLRGGLTMAAFGLGTASALLVLGIFSAAFSLKLNRWGSRLAAISILLLGLFILTRGALPMMTTHAANGDRVEQSCRN